MAGKNVHGLRAGAALGRTARRGCFKLGEGHWADANQRFTLERRRDGWRITFGTAAWTQRYATAIKTGHFVPPRTMTEAKGQALEIVEAIPERTNGIPRVLETGTCGACGQSATRESDDYLCLSCRAEEPVRDA